MPKVFNRQPRAFHCCGVRLLPGKQGNELSEEEIAKLSANPQFQSWCALGWIGVRQQPVPQNEQEPEPAAAEPDQVTEPSSPGEALARVNVIEAREMIAECTDPEMLLSWFENDSRQTVHAAIEKRMKALEDTAVVTQDPAKPDETAAQDGSSAE